MQYYHLNQLFDEMNRVIRWQSEQLVQLEREIAQIKEQLEKLKSAPTNHVEKIEYNFEQLKVENLNGTLVIGLTPNDTGSIENMWIKEHYSEDVTLGQQPDHALSQQIETDLYPYIRGEMPSLLKDKADAKSIRLSEEHVQSIVEDMARQSGGRIRFYLHRFQGKEGTGGNGLKDQVLQRMKEDLMQAIDAYIEHFRKDDANE